MRSLTPEQVLLRPSSDVVANKSHIIEWLQSIGIPHDSIRSEYQLQGGTVDIYLTNRRVMIQVNEMLDKAHTGMDGSTFEQLEKYLKIEREREREHFDDDEELDWVGIITNGSKWWMWRWSAENECIICDGWQGKMLDKNNIDELTELFSRKVGKEWATSNISSLFDGVKNDLFKIYLQKKDLKSTNMQKGLWLDQLKASGNDPSTKIDDLFVSHTLLILIARSISQVNPLTGYAEWVPYEEYKKIHTIIHQYNWRQETSDILRNIYHHFVPVLHRKMFGEYFTPDWVAEKICSIVIDDQYIDEQINNFKSKKIIQGILDPCCGSGTFLYNAIKLIIKSKPIKKSGFTEIDMTDFICKIIHGIDIHPVTIELAHANVHRILPHANSQNIQIYRGDSLCNKLDDVQSRPINLQKNIARIVSNPPWVSFDKIQVKERKNDIRELGINHEIWIGREYTKFDIASLFVCICADLYLKNDGKAGWLLPDGAMFDGTWEKLRTKLQDQITGIWDLQSLPFPKQAPSCVMFINVDTTDRKLVKNEGAKIKEGDNLASVEKKTKWEYDIKKFVVKKSDWHIGDKSIIRAGASIRPHCFTWVKNIKKMNNDQVEITTKPSIHPPWKQFGSLTGIIPKNWIKTCLSSHDIVQYSLYKTTTCVIPIINNEWDASCSKIKFWSNASDIYTANAGQGDSTPKKLDGKHQRLDKNNKLGIQFNRKGYYIVHNNSGNKLYASRLYNNDHIITDTLYYMKCKSKNEALFLVGILNAKCLLPAFLSCKQTNKHFAGLIWKKIPIPRYDKSNKHHNELVSLVSKAEKFSKNFCEKNPTTPTRLKKLVTQGLEENGTSDKIDKVVKMILPSYV